jgi:hypothetical protein
MYKLEAYKPHHKKTQTWHRLDNAKLWARDYINRGYKCIITDLDTNEVVWGKSPEPKKEVAIYLDVVGCVASGKSTVIDIIDEALRGYGINNIQINDVDGPHSQSRGKFIAKTVELADQNLKVTINETQAVRERLNVKPIKGQECICPDGMGRVAGFNESRIWVKTRFDNRGCWWAKDSVELIDPRK